MKSTTAAEDWDHIQSLFPARNAVTSSSWAYSVSQRMSRKRISTMLKSSGSKALKQHLDDRSTVRLKALRTFAAINLEQASAAFRITIIVNVSIPIVFLTIVNQMFPGLLSETFTLGFTASGQAIWIFLISLVLTIVGLIWILVFALASLNQARDIRHLIDLYAAERGVFFGLEDTAEMQSG